jgi:hypothetical protein
VSTCEGPHVPLTLSASGARAAPAAPPTPLTRVDGPLRAVPTPGADSRTRGGQTVATPVYKRYDVTNRRLLVTTNRRWVGLLVRLYACARGGWACSYAHILVCILVCVCILVTLVYSVRLYTRLSGSCVCLEHGADIMAII